MKKPVRKAKPRVARARPASKPGVPSKLRPPKFRNPARPAAPAVITLPAHFDIQSVAGVAEMLRERVNAAAPLLIDAAGVTSTDTAGLQLLLAARRAARARAVAFEWRGVSDALRATSATIGLSEALGLP